MTDAELNAELKARGMFSLEEMMHPEPNKLDAFMAHTGVSDYDTFGEWLEKRRREMLMMRLKYELSDTQDEMYEWVLAHSGALNEVWSNWKQAKYRMKEGET